MFRLLKNRSFDQFEKQVYICYGFIVMAFVSFGVIVINS